MFLLKKPSAVQRVGKSLFIVCITKNLFFLMK
jgi:hypothetical protein